MIVYVDLCECYAARFAICLRELLEYRRDLLAWSAPVCVEVGDNIGVGGEQFLELRGGGNVCYSRHRRIVDIVFKGCAVIEEDSLQGRLGMQIGALLPELKLAPSSPTNGVSLAQAT